jgi:S1-C subfamily serine protease
VVGNPVGLTASLTTGVISGLDREFQSPNGGPNMTDLIQFDAPINPGNSGGPLLNRDGEVVGIVAARPNVLGEISLRGIDFAVPIDIARPLLGPSHF